MVEIIRGDLDSIKLITIGSLIVLDVHSLDVVEQLMNDKISNLEAFDWVSQLRYYIQDNSLISDKEKRLKDKEMGKMPPVEVHLKMVTTTR